MSTIREWAEDLVEAGGYPGLGAAILAENLFPPIPSEVILPLAGFYVGQGDLRYGPAVAAATAGSLLGALLIYAVARRGGRPLLLRYGRLLRISERELDRADAWFDRHGAWIVLFGRLVPGVRTLVSIPAGLSEMPVGRFVGLTLLGSAVWNAALIGAGWALGGNYERVAGTLGPIAAGTLVAVAAGLLATGVWLYRRKAPRR